MLFLLRLVDDAPGRHPAERAARLVGLCGVGLPRTFPLGRQRPALGSARAGTSVKWFGTVGSSGAAGLRKDGGGKGLGRKLPSAGL